MIRSTEGARSTLGGWILLQGILAAAWLATWWLGHVQEYTPHASLWFPPAGLSLAALQVFRARALPGITVAAVVATLLLEDGAAPGLGIGQLILAGLAFAAAHAGSYLAAAELIRRWGSPRPTPGTVTVSLLITPVAALAAALLGPVALAATGLMSATEIPGLVLPWWIGDFTALVAIAPGAALALDRLAEGLDLPTSGILDGARRVPAASTGVGALILKLVLCTLPLAVSVSVLLLSGTRDLVPSFLVFFAIIPLMWIAHTEGAIRTYAATAVLSTLIAGAGGLLGPGEHTVTYQFAMIVLAAAAFFGLAVPILYQDNASLRRRVTTDGLTGTMARDWFLDTARQEIERARRFSTTLSLIVFDLDQFKALNDRHGHLFGDRALTVVADRALRELREADSMGRLGGEEFAILLPMTSHGRAVSVARRVAAALRREPVRSGDVSTPITASFGVVEVDVEREGFNEAFDRADRALYRAKELGRDRVETG